MARRKTFRELLPLCVYDESGGLDVAGDCAIRAIASVTGTPYKTLFGDFTRYWEHTQAFMDKRQMPFIDELEKSGTPGSYFVDYLSGRGWIEYNLRGATLLDVARWFHKAKGKRAIVEVKYLRDRQAHVMAICNGVLIDKGPLFYHPQRKACRLYIHENQDRWFRRRLRRDIRGDNDRSDRRKSEK